MLQIQDISFAYHSPQGETQVLDHISFSIREGEFVAIVGPSGCGKSTLLSMICGLLKPDYGKVVLKHKKRVGYMLQKDHLLEWRTTWKNIALGPEIAGKTGEFIDQRIQSLLNAYGLAEFANARPNELSGGMRQRVALIRTLMLSPDLLLLDEPFSALDYQTRLTVSDDVWSILKKEHKTALLITHDISEAISMADRIIILSARPATVITERTVSLNVPPQATPLDRRSAPEFKDYFNFVWKELNQHE